MPPVALCSSGTCTYFVKLQDSNKGVAVTTPLVCPTCAAPMLAFCPQCGFLLLGEIDAGDPRCVVCRANIRAVYHRLRSRVANEHKASSFQLDRPLSTRVQICRSNSHLRRSRRREDR